MIMADPVLIKDPPFFVPKREYAPPGYTGWAREAVDLFAMYNEGFDAWLSDLKKEQALFKTHVYENNDLTDTDLRQHREHLCGLLSVGESLALAFMRLGQEQSDKAKDVVPYVNLIDQKLKELFSVLFAWHGPLQCQSDVPDSFKQSVSEAESGKLVDLDV
jgi:hypothetical protein